MNRKVVIGLAVVSLTTIAAIGWVYLCKDSRHEDSNNYIEGQIRVGLKPYVDRELLVEFANKHPEISVDVYSSSSGPINFRADAQISLRPYIEWQSRIASEDDQEIRQLVSAREDELRFTYESLKSNPLLNNAVFHEAFYSESFPEGNELPYVYFDFKEGVSEEDFNEFLSQFKNHPRLEIVESSGERRFYTIQVPPGKEGYWISEFGKQEFVETAYPNFSFQID